MTRRNLWFAVRIWSGLVVLRLTGLPGQTQTQQVMLIRGRTRSIYRVAEVESQVPPANADTFRKGNLGVRDYYDLRNVQADTDMREALAGHQEHEEGA